VRRDVPTLISGNGPSDGTAPRTAPLEKLAAAAGLPEIDLHDVRHSGLAPRRHPDRPERQQTTS
jgi:hypothetical protein